MYLGCLVDPFGGHVTQDPAAAEQVCFLPRRSGASFGSGVCTARPIPSSQGPRPLEIGFLPPVPCICPGAHGGSSFM